MGTIHLNCENTDLIHQAYLEALDESLLPGNYYYLAELLVHYRNMNGKLKCLSLLFHDFNRPMIEMTLPSALDPTVAPAGAHVAQMFVQSLPTF